MFELFGTIISSLLKKGKDKERPDFDNISNSYSKLVTSLESRLTKVEKKEEECEKQRELDKERVRILESKVEDLFNR